MWAQLKALGDGERMHIVPTGALTNVALLLKLFPESKDKIASITLMGGAIGIGNRGPCAEFNIQNDPEVLASRQAPRLEARPKCLSWAPRATRRRRRLCSSLAAEWSWSPWRSRTPY